MPITVDELAALQAAEFGDRGARLLQHIEQDRREIDWRDAKLAKLIFEKAQLKRMKFGKRSEQLDAEQRALFDEAVDADIAATEDRLKELLAGSKQRRGTGAGAYDFSPELVSAIVANPLAAGAVSTYV